MAAKTEVHRFYIHVPLIPGTPACLKEEMNPFEVVVAVIPLDLRAPATIVPHS